MKKANRILTISTFTFILFLITAGCSLKKDINLGFSAELTGSRGELGVDLRDGAILAVEEINLAGGIDGRTVKLIIKDDEGTGERALEVDRELFEQNVYAVIGHVTSLITGEAIKQANEREVVLFSPASASSDFSGHKDFFFRNMGDNRLSAFNMAHHMLHNRKVGTTCIIYDKANIAFTGSYVKHFTAEYTRIGGKMAKKLDFLPGEVDYNEMVKEIKAEGCEAVLIIASAVDTALILQHLDQEGLSLAHFAHGWAQTSELLKKGGRAVEGLEIGATFNAESDSPVFLEFKERFNKRFSRSPGFLSVYSYEAVKILCHAIEKTEFDRKRLPEELVEIKEFPGVLGPITINEYGDVIRDSYIVRVEGGEFKFVKAIRTQDD